jgi:hypothetical protein
MNGIMVDTRVDLRRFDELYRNEVVDGAETRIAIPDGRYEVRVDLVELRQSKSSGNPMLKWTLRITGSTFRGRILWKYRAITENTIKYVKQELSVCGLELAQFSALRDHLDSLTGIELEVTKITRGEDSNILFNRRLGAAYQGDGGVCDDDIPF